MSNLRNKLALMYWGDEVIIEGYHVRLHRGGTFIVSKGLGTNIFIRTKSVKKVIWYLKEILEVKED